MSGRQGWLGQGWVRDHKSSMLHRLPGELHKGPPGLGGWTNENLAIMLRSFSKGNAERMDTVRGARTRQELLVLADAWSVPFVTQAEWLASDVTDPIWFHVPRPEDHGPLQPPARKHVYVVALEKHVARPPETATPDWEWREAIPDRMRHWFSVSGRERLRARSCPLVPGTRLWAGVMVNDLEPRFQHILLLMSQPDEALVVFEVLPESGLESGQLLSEAVERVFETRRHRQDLSRWDETVGAWSSLCAEDRLDEQEDAPQGFGGASLVALLVREPAADLLDDEDTAIRIMKEHFESASEFEREEVMRVFWRHPVEGAKNHVAVAVETRFSYSCPGMPPQSGSKVIYALIDTATGRLLDSLVQSKPPPADGSEGGGIARVSSPHETLSKFLA
uniref:Uncharacterized protein n=1 Tax=Rhizochromulina marina TaxID=1034831 RepID=A0A7S2WD56_9STRA